MCKQKLYGTYYMFNDQYFKNLPSTAELMDKYKLRTDKKLGQNFLFDSSITDQILTLIGDISDQYVLEIGPGPGTLTRSILASNPKKVFAVELDKQCLPILEDIKAVDPDKLDIVIEDALTIDESTYCTEPMSVIANLPYNIGTALIIKWLSNIEHFTQIIVMLQKEVVERMCAVPRSGHYGKLSVFIQTLCDATILMDVEPHHFHPAPKVMSSVIKLTPKSIRVDKQFLTTLSKITNAAFAMRRKKIKTSLAGLVPHEQLESLGVDVNKRAEEVSVSEYHTITNFLIARHG